MNVYDIDDCFLEYSGNPDKNQEFKEILDDLDGLLKHFEERIFRLSDIEQKIYNIILDCDKKGKITKKDTDMINSFIPGFNNWFEKESKKFSSQVIWRRFDTTVGKFNNKYSNVVMEYKKNFFSSAAETLMTITELATPWAKDSANNKKLNYAYDHLGEIDKSYRDSMFSVYDKINHALIQETNATINDIMYIQKKLNIVKTEKSLSYKLINAVFRK